MTYLFDRIEACSVQRRRNVSFAERLHPFRTHATHRASVDADSLPPGACRRPLARLKRGRGAALSTRLNGILTGAALAVGAAVLSAGVFVAFVAPSWPRTVWGWLLSAALGLPLLVLVQ